MVKPSGSLPLPGSGLFWTRIALPLTLVGVVFFYPVFAMLPVFMEDNTPPVARWVFAGVLLVAVGCFGLTALVLGGWHSRRQRGNRQRVRDLQRVAAELGLVYSRHIRLVDLEPFRDLLLFRFSQHSAWEAGDGLRGPVNGLRVWLFEFHFLGQFRNQDDVVRRFRVGQTVVLVPRAAPLPPFRLGPAQSKWDEMMPAWHVLLGAGDPALTLGKDRSVLVHADDPDLVRWLFDPARVAELGDLAGWVVESEGANLLLYRPGEVVPPDHLPAFLHRAALIAGVLTRNLPEAPVSPDAVPSSEVRPGRPGDFLT